MELWEHQEDVRAFARDKDGVLIWHGMGAGKSFSAICIMEDVEAKNVLILCPKTVIKTWVDQFEKYIEINPSANFSLFAPTKGSIKKKAKDIEKFLNYRPGQKTKVIVLNYEACWRPGLGPVKDKYKNITGNGLLKKLDWDIIACDECFIANTPIDTPYGSVHIQDLKPGDKIYGYDHKKNKIVTTLVKETMINQVPSSHLCEIAGLIPTKGHPFYVGSKYTPAGLLNDTNFLYKRNEHGIKPVKLQNLRQTTHDKTNQKMEFKQKGKSKQAWSFLQSFLFFKGNKKSSGNNRSNIENMGKENRHPSKAKMYGLPNTINNKTNTCSFKKETKVKKRNNGSLLQPFLFSKVENESAESSSKDIHKRSKQEIIDKNAGDLEQIWLKTERSSPCKGEFSGESIYKKQRRNTQKSSHHSEKNGLSVLKWWQWAWLNKATRNIIQSIKEIIPRAYMGNGTNFHQLLARIPKGTSLQNRHCEPTQKGRNRSRWPDSSILSRSNERSKKDKGFNFQRLDSNEIQEQRNPGGCNKSVAVYNIETGTNNYFANGILTHNCQKIKAPGSKVSIFVSKLRGQKRLALSGTPFPNSPLDTFAIYRFLDKSIFEHINNKGKRSLTYQQFKMKYAEWGGFEQRQVVKYINQQELNEKVYSIAHRIRTEDVVELPDFQHIFIECNLNAGARRAYDAFKKEAVIQFQNGEELSAANVLTKYLRLAQIASGTVKDDAGNEHLVDDSKLRALKTLLLGIDEPVVIFTRFKAEVTQIKEMIGKFRREGERERVVAELTGDKDERDKFASGEAEIIVVNLQAGGTGVNELVRARYGIYFSTGYSSADYEQSLWRIRRPGSDVTKKTLYYHITARGTIDELIMQAIERKMDLIEAVLRDFSKDIILQAA